MKSKRRAYGLVIATLAIQLQSLTSTMRRWEEFGDILDEDEKKEIEKLDDVLFKVSGRMLNLSHHLRPVNASK